MAKIINESMMADALRNTGYKNIESAMSEIIDNSIQWESKDIFVIVKETLNSVTGKKNVSEIAFLDNGTGMSDNILSDCLTMGYTTNRNRKGMGRFGVGLPQASMHACPKVEVYSWTKENHGIEQCKKVYLDIELVKSGDLTEIDSPIREDIPLEYNKYIHYKYEKFGKEKEADFSQKGTLVIWKNCDRVVPKMAAKLFDKIELELGRRFRYFINDGRCNIRLISSNEERDIMPNDPLFLMENNIVLGNAERPGDIRKRDHIDFNEPLFEPYSNENCPDGVIKLPVKYYDPITGEIKDGIVTLKFSKIKNKFYDRDAIVGSKLPGSTDMGKFVKDLEGISVVRADREIDFGRFDFYEITNSPTHRWWGCEINFNPELDEAFGVSNNKQYVELRAVDASSYEDDEVQPMWLQLSRIIKPTIDAMFNKNKEDREGTKKGMPTSSATEIINDAEEKREDKDFGKTANIKESKTEEEILEEARKDLINNGNENPTEEDVIEYMRNRVPIFYKNLSQYGPLFDFSFELGMAKIEVNMQNIFYVTVLESLFNDVDFKTAFELLFASFVKAIDVTEEIQKNAYDKLIEKWNQRLKEYLIKRIENNIENGCENLSIITAFCKLDTLRYIDGFTSRVATKKIVIRFRLDDIISGATDKEIYDYCKQNNWELYINLDLHAKVYMIDDICFIGSANTTNSGLNINRLGNIEISKEFELTDEEKTQLNKIFSGSKKLEDDLYNKMISQLDNINIRKSHKYRWDENILREYNQSYNLLFQEDFPINNNPNNLELDEKYLEIFKDDPIDKIKEKFEDTKIFKWLVYILSIQKNNEIYFGELSEKIHSIIFQEPKQYRKDVKELEDKLINWIQILNYDYIKVDKPNYSTRVRLVK